jgi:HTH-type transcriptional regulator/antitoxin HigA
MVMPLVYENIKDMEPDKKSAIYTLVQITKGRARFVEVNPYDAELLGKFIPKIKDLSSEPLIAVKEPLKDMLAACGVIIVYLPIIDNITSTCITYSKGNSIVLGIPTEDSDAFWTLLDEALHNLLERDYPRSNRKYRNNDPVTVVNY